MSERERSLGTENHITGSEQQRPRNSWETLSAFVQHCIEEGLRAIVAAGSGLPGAPTGQDLQPGVLSPPSGVTLIEGVRLGRSKSGGFFSRPIR